MLKYVYILSIIPHYLKYENIACVWELEREVAKNSQVDNERPQYQISPLTCK